MDIKPLEHGIQETWNPRIIVPRFHETKGPLRKGPRGSLDSGNISPGSIGPWEHETKGTLDQGNIVPWELESKYVLMIKFMKVSVSCSLCSVLISSCQHTYMLTKMVIMVDVIC